jgi:L-ascorbate metabolism protein UlaG (beta-lactamase superfamily)
MKIYWISHSCFRVESGGKQIYFDPYEIPKGSPAADVIFASHDHYDHFDEKAVKSILKKETAIIGPTSVANKNVGIVVKTVKPGDKGSAAGFNFEAVPAYNPAKKFHPKQNNWCGFVVTVEGKTIYHAGDTDLIPEFGALTGKIDLALLPVGDTYTMGFKDAIKAVGVIKPKHMIPMHQWDSDLDDFKEQCEKNNPQTVVHVIPKGSMDL